MNPYSVWVKFAYDSSRNTWTFCGFSKTEKEARERIDPEVEGQPFEVFEFNSDGSVAKLVKKMEAWIGSFPDVPKKDVVSIRKDLAECILNCLDEVLGKTIDKQEETW